MGWGWGRGNWTQGVGRFGESAPLYKLSLFLEIIILGRDLTHSFGFLSSFHPEQGAQSGIVQSRDILSSTAFQRLQPQPRASHLWLCPPLARLPPPLPPRGQSDFSIFHIPLSQRLSYSLVDMCLYIHLPHPPETASRTGTKFHLPLYPGA